MPMKNNATKDAMTGISDTIPNSAKIDIITKLANGKAIGIK